MALLGLYAGAVTLLLIALVIWLLHALGIYNIPFLSEVTKRRCLVQSQPKFQATDEYAPYYMQLMALKHKETGKFCKIGEWMTCDGSTPETATYMKMRHKDDPAKQLSVLTDINGQKICTDTSEGVKCGGTVTQASDVNLKLTAMEDGTMTLQDSATSKYCNADATGKAKCDSATVPAKGFAYV